MITRLENAGMYSEEECDICNNLPSVLLVRYEDSDPLTIEHSRALIWYCAECAKDPEIVLAMLQMKVE